MLFENSYPAELEPPPEPPPSPPPPLDASADALLLATKSKNATESKSASFMANQAGMGTTPLLRKRFTQAAPAPIAMANGSQCSKSAGDAAVLCAAISIT